MGELQSFTVGAMRGQGGERVPQAERYKYIQRFNMVQENNGSSSLQTAIVMIPLKYIQYVVPVIPEALLHLQLTAQHLQTRGIPGTALLVLYVHYRHSHHEQHPAAKDADADTSTSELPSSELPGGAQVQIRVCCLRAELLRVRAGPRAEPCSEDVPSHL